MFRIRIVILLACCAPLAAMADDQSSTSTEPQRVLVMSTGRVVQGTISETPGGYSVAMPNGTRFSLPFSEVTCTATSLREAHQKLQQVVAPPSASGHVLLSRWCMENHLYDLAMEEVQSALQLEPGRTEARQLLWQLEQILNPSQSAMESQDDAPFSWDNFAAPPVAAPGGLTRDTTNEFVRRVQPLMLNTCANARCHGRPGSSFHLDFVPSSGVSGQSITTANIEEVFEYVDIDSPRESRLFKAIVDTSIVQHRQVMLGPRGREHLELIAAWISQGSLERGGSPPAITSPEVLTADASSPVASGDVTLAAMTNVDDSTPRASHVPMTLDDAPPISIDPLPRSTTAGPLSSREPPAAPILQEVAAPQPIEPPNLFETPRSDAFDPNAFNRRVHGRP